MCKHAHLVMFDMAPGSSFVLSLLSELFVIVCNILGQKEDLVLSILTGRGWYPSSSILSSSLSLVTFSPHHQTKLSVSIKFFYVCLCNTVIEPQSIDELKQHKSYVKLLKKQCKELKELRKKHLRKV